MSERAAAWKLWQQNPCWQEMLTMIDDIKRESVRDEDSVPTSEINVAVVGECRGVRKGLTRLLRKIENITNQE